MVIMAEAISGNKSRRFRCSGIRDICASAESVESEKSVDERPTLYWSTVQLSPPSAAAATSTTNLPNTVYGYDLGGRLETTLEK